MAKKIGGLQKMRGPCELLIKTQQGGSRIHVGKEREGNGGPPTMKEEGSKNGIHGGRHSSREGR